MPHKTVIKHQKQQCICRQQQAIRQLKRRPVLMRTDTMTGKFTKPFNVAKGRLRELSWANKHTTGELAKDDNTRCDPQLHAKWLQDHHKGDKVQCRREAVQLAIGERLDDTHRKPPLMVARPVWTISSVPLGEIEDHDCVVGHFDRAMNGARAAVRACGGSMEHKWLRDV